MSYGCFHSLGMEKSPIYSAETHRGVINVCTFHCVTGQRSPPPGAEVLKQKLISAFMSSSAHFRRIEDGDLSLF